MRPHLTRRESLALLAATLGTPAAAQTWPSKEITFVVPFPAGGATDAIARLLAEKMGKKLGQLGMDTVAKAPPDGHVVAVTLSTQLVINPFLFKKLPHDPKKDLALAGSGWSSRPARRSTERRVRRG